MKKWLCIFICIFNVFVTKMNLDAAEIPIIFVHGNKCEGNTSAGFNTWNPSDYYTAMKKILEEKYKGYVAGNPLNCDKYTTLQPMNTTKVIYNFSYYHPNGTPGAIGSNGCIEEKG